MHDLVTGKHTPPCYQSHRRACYPLHKQEKPHPHDCNFILTPSRRFHPPSVHFMIMTFTLGNRPRSRRRAGAEVVFGGCQPVDYGRTPCDCRSVNTIARSEQARKTGQRGRGHSLSEPTILVSIQSEEDDEVRDSRQDNGRGAESGSSHEEFACYDGITQTGDFAEGQSHGDAR